MTMRFSQNDMIKASLSIRFLFLIAMSIAVSSVSGCEPVVQARYDNYRLYRVTLKTDEHVRVFQELEDMSDSYVFYGHARHTDQNLTILVSAHKIAEFTELLTHYGVASDILTYNIQSKIDAEAKNTKPATATADDFDWNNYFHLATIRAWAENLAENYDFITLFDFGRSYEDRPLWGIKLSKKSGNVGVVVEGGIHAREWISPATATFILNQLIISQDPDVIHLSENYDWYFVPVLNVDGYVYSFDRDRLWRKTRKPNGLCYGVDLNRNFDANWSGVGSSGKPCTYDYAGPEANSEPEAKQWSEYLERSIVANNVKIYLSLHSFSQLVMFPFGSTEEHVSNYDILKAIGEKAVEALARRYGTKYETGSIYEIIYPSSGGSMDWVKEKFDLPITYTFELRGPPDTKELFILPANQITPTGWETLDAFVTIIKESERLNAL